MSAAAPTLVGDELKQAIKRQVEFYFSKANLATDAFLVSNMNSQMFVPVDVIVTFAKVKALTTDAALVVDAVKDSKLVALNAANDAIKPNIKSERTTIILREIPSATAPADVEAIFADCASKVESVRSDVGDTWFVTMATEEDAVNTLLALRNKTFNDAPIKARLKSENALKSFFPTQPPVDSVNAPGPSAAAYGSGRGGYYTAAPTGYYDVPNNYGVHYQATAGAHAPSSYSHNNGGSNDGRYTQRTQHHNSNSGGRGNSANQARHAQSGRGNSSNSSTNNNNNAQAKDAAAKTSSATAPASSKKQHKDTKKAAAKQTPASNGAAKKAAPATTAAAATSSSASASSASPAAGATASTTTTERQPILSASNFPPLPATSDKPDAYAPIKHTYHHEDIMEIVKHMDETDCELPARKMDYDAHPAALTAVAHPDLLRNQRTYSIEQAREAMRQGRPIRSDSVGSIDYESLMYGEDYTKEAREQRKQQTSASSATTASTGADGGDKKDSKPAAAKVFSFATAVINGTPATPATIEASKKKPAAAPAASAGDKPKTAAASATTATGKDEKKAPAAAAKKPVAAIADNVQKADETLPKAGAWGGRNFLDVVKSEPVQPPAAPVKTTSAAATATAVDASKKSDNKVWERNVSVASDRK